jgi:MltA specific insert domain
MRKILSDLTASEVKAQLVHNFAEVPQVMPKDEWPATRGGTLCEWSPVVRRGQIEDGALDGQRLEICWLRNPADALAVQIEGSARVRLEDGAVLRINYDAHKGREIGRARRALRLSRLEVSDREDPFAAIIRCTADSGVKAIQRADGGIAAQH